MEKFRRSICTEFQMCLYSSRFQKVGVENFYIHTN